MINFTHIFKLHIIQKCSQMPIIRKIVHSTTALIMQQLNCLYIHRRLHSDIKHVTCCYAPLPAAVWYIGSADRTVMYTDLLIVALSFYVFSKVWLLLQYVCHEADYQLYLLVIYLSGFITAVAVFRKPNAIPLCFSTDLVLNFLLSWLLVLLPSTFFLDVLFSFCPVVSIP